MSTTKRLIHVFGGLIQLLLGLAFLFLAGFTFYQWIIKQATDTFLSGLFTNLPQILHIGEMAVKIVTPIAFLLLGIILIFFASDLMGSPYKDETKKRCREKRVLSLLSAILNGAIGVFIFIAMTDDPLEKYAKIVGIVTFILAFAELITVFLSYNKHLSKENFTQNINEQSDDSVQTTVNAEEFNERAKMLQKLYKKGKITDETFKRGLAVLMSLPVDMPLSFKINHLNNFAKKRLLDKDSLPVYICKAIVSPCSSSTKERMKYLNTLHDKNIINDAAFNSVVTKLMGPAAK
ncbi:MAG: hypothetical protein SPK59_05870 [Eubacteriales bacterium]|nr:hypothetical protein [Eubacteriales bacterium]